MTIVYLLAGFTFACVLAAIFPAFITILLQVIAARYSVWQYDRRERAYFGPHGRNRWEDHE